MAALCDLRLIVHGSIILLLSQFAGYAFLFAINARRQDTVRTGMWRMSHAACSAGAVFLIALGPVVPHLRLAPGLLGFLIASLIISTYGLCLGTVVAGISGHRGTRLQRPWTNVIANLLYIVGALGSTIAGILLCYGAVRTYLAA